MDSNATFVFKGYKYNMKKGECEFNYKLATSREKINFSEKILFPPVENSRINQVLNDRILGNLLLILGISYWKLYCPKNIKIKPFSLTKEQADFWNTIYTKGMGEFYYKNKIDFRGLVNFPYDEKKKAKSISFLRKNRSLVGIGGGKDSIVSAELLKKNNKDFDLVTSTFPIQIKVANLIGGKVLNTKRKIDPKLLELAKQNNVYNGHIPISVYYAFLLILMAALFDYRYVIVSNEKSANYGNVEYLMTIINHQWSKSEEFEKLFQNYVARFITKDIQYFSLLRPLSEIKIVELFTKHKKYFPVYSSCNMNFKMQQNVTSRWCGKCAKCAFVFALLSAFISKQELVGIFGKNLFQDQALIFIFEELLGIKNFKPFECVGTSDEIKLAMYRAYKRKYYNNDIVMKMFIKKVLPTIKPFKLKENLFKVSSKNSIPQDFQSIIKSL